MSTTETANKPYTIAVILRANRQIGTGHLMRLRPLLPKLKPYAHLHLYAYAFDPNLRRLCEDYDEISLFSTADEILEHLLQLPKRSSDPKEALGSTKEQLSDLILIDDYALDERFEAPLFARTKVFVIDDLINRRHHCHILLDQTLLTEHKVERYKALCNTECRFLIGPEYTLTSEHFYPQNFKPQHCSCGAHHGAYVGRVPLPHCQQGQQCLCCDAQAQAALPRVLVSFGGADPLSASLRLTKTILQGRLYMSWSFTLLTGMSNTDYDALIEAEQQVPEKYRQNFTVLRHCYDIADLLYRHELSLGAYGGMLRERIATGLPTVGVVIADNQFEGPAIFKRYNIGLDLSFEQLSDSQAVDTALQTTLRNATEMTKNCLKIYDGKGLQRISTAILDLIQ